MKKTVRNRAVAMVLAAGMVMGNGTGVVFAAESSATEAQAKQSNYPLTITTFNFAKEPVEETFEKAPERVICAWTNSVETMLALGLGDRIVSTIGVTEKDILPELREEYAKIAEKEFNNFTDSNAAMTKETGIMLEPDFILAWKSTFSDKSLGDVDYWHENGVNTYMALNSNDISETRTVENEYTDILTIGKIFDVEEKAQAIVDEMEASVEEVMKVAEGQEKEKVLIVEFLGDTIRTYDKTTLAGDMVNKMGGELLDTQGQISAEDLVGLNPDVLFVIYFGPMGQDAEMTEEEADKKAAEEAVANITENPAFASLKAVQEGKVFPLLLSDCYTSGIRTINGLNAIGEALYPEAYQE